MKSLTACKCGRTIATSLAGFIVTPLGYCQLLSGTYGTAYADVQDQVVTIDQQGNRNFAEYYADENYDGLGFSVSDLHAFPDVFLAGVPGATTGEENSAASMTLVNQSSNATLYADFSSSADISTTVDGAYGFASAAGFCDGDSYGQFSFVLSSPTTMNISALVTAVGPGATSQIEIYGITNDYTVLEQNAPTGTFNTQVTLGSGYYLINYDANSLSQFSYGVNGVGDQTGMNEARLDLTTTFTPEPEPEPMTAVATLCAVGALCRRRRVRT